MPPRGGRGGAGAGRARPAAGKVRIGGIDIEYDEETQSEAQNRPQPALIFPSYEVTAARPITARERVEAARYTSLRDSIRKGPLYTTLEDATDPDAIGLKKKRSAAAAFDAFNGMQTYSMRYEVKRKGNPPLHSRPFVLEFFPPELHATLDPASRTNTARAPKRRKQLQTEVDEIEVDVDGAADDAPNDEDEDAAGRRPEDGEEPIDEVADDDFDEDEDDDDGADDYNGEKYFDDGEGGDDDLDGGGGDDGEM